MHSRFRSALLWLLLLALPLQVFAAASMVHCGASHHRMMQAASPAVGDAQGHAMHAHHHEMATVDPMHSNGAGDAEHGASSVHDLDKLSKFKCSACAACCTGAAMPTAALFIPLLPTATKMAVFVFGPHVDFLSGGLDRPPRNLLV